MGKGIMRVISAAAVIVFAAYFGYYLINYSSDMLTTATVEAATVYDDFSAPGFFIRKEKPVFYDGPGFVVLEAKDGYKLAAGELIASVYKAEEDVARQVETRRLQSLINTLEAGIDGTRYGPAELSNIEDRLTALEKKLASLLSQGLGAELRAVTEEINTLLCKKQMILADELQIQEAYALLESYKAEVKNRLSASISKIEADQPGYFVGITDGYENILTPDIIASLTPGDLEALKQASPEENAVGKLITDFKWYFAVTAENEKVDGLKENSAVIIRFPFAMDISVPARVEKISESQDGKRAVVFSSTYVLGELGYLRTQTASVVKREISGLRVDSRAIRVVDGVTGVYAIRGSTVKFIPVEVLYSTENYYLVKWDQTKTGALMQQEKVVIEGKDLYDGKQIN